MGVIVVGAGIAGLACARVIADAGVPVRVWERAAVPGGRLATTELDGRPADTGAAYFTVSDPGFAEVVEGWRRAGLARPWTDTFQVYDRAGRHVSSGPTRWAAPGGLRSLAERFAAGLPVTTGRLVSGIGPGPRVDGEAVDAVVLAMPGPQALRLLHSPQAPAARAAGTQRWSPALAAVLRYPRRTWPDFAGAFVNGHPVLTAVCDDGDRRGDGEPVLVAHSTAGFAAAHGDDPAGAAGLLEEAVRELLDLPQPSAQRHVCRWRFARPERQDAVEPFHLGEDGVGLAGDAFGEPRVQTAWYSGQALGRALVARLPAR